MAHQCPRTPIGRGSRLRTGSVKVRIFPGAPYLPVAQLGSALDLGSRGRVFESLRADHICSIGKKGLQYRLTNQNPCGNSQDPKV